MDAVTPAPVPPDDVDGWVELLDGDRGSRADGRWVSSDMVMSLDGAFARHGRSAGLSSPADHACFLAHRQLADVVLVGAGTARDERYRRPSVGPAAARCRDRRGQEERPLLVLVSGRLHLPDDLPLLEGDGPEPLVVHPATSDPRHLPAGVRHEECGDTHVDLTELLDRLAARGLRRVACEGGPHLLGALAQRNALDEYLVTLAPLLVGGPAVGLLGGVDLAGVQRADDGSGDDFSLHRVVRDRHHLLLSYRRPPR